jgi:hypothetical protein
MAQSTSVAGVVGQLQVEDRRAAPGIPQELASTITARRAKLASRGFDARADVEPSGRCQHRSGRLAEKLVVRQAGDGEPAVALEELTALLPIIGPGDASQCQDLDVPVNRARGRSEFIRQGSRAVAALALEQLENSGGRARKPGRFTFFDELPRLVQVIMLRKSRVLFQCHAFYALHRSGRSRRRPRPIDISRTRAGSSWIATNSYLLY